MATKKPDSKKGAKPASNPKPGKATKPKGSKPKAARAKKPA